MAKIRIEPKPPQQPKTPYVPTAQDFLTWVEGRSGLTWREFFDAWVGAYNLTSAQINSLWNQVKDKGPKEPKPPEPKPPEPKKPKEPIVPKETIIQRTPYPKWWRDSGVAPIYFTGPKTNQIISSPTKGKLYISTIVILVDGETNISLSFGTAGSSGAMPFGGEGQPMGISIPMGNSPAPCGMGGFSITSTGEDVYVSGFAVYYYEED